jgi:hypothetical protein
MKPEQLLPAIAVAALVLLSMIIGITSTHFFDKMNAFSVAIVLAILVNAMTRKY